MIAITKINHFVMNITLKNLCSFSIFTCLAGKSIIYVIICSGKFL